MMQDSASDDFLNSNYKKVDTENSGTDSSACSLIEDDCSLVETVYAVCSLINDSRRNPVKGRPDTSVQNDEDHERYAAQRYPTHVQSVTYPANTQAKEEAVPAENQDRI
ncbi:hypothetical protein TNCV_582601 [Trichonephila clavipes]|nr:hypothetical protein TNCV_582601 [Trichonephila clavipes]